MSSKEHLAAILEGRGKNFTIAKRPTPTPGPNEVLIEAKSLALNPVDHIQRTSGFSISGYPAVLGSDVAGTVVAVGEAVKRFKIGDRVTAFAPCFSMKGSPNYGAFQEKVLVPEQYVSVIPASLTFNNAAMLPMAVATGWLAFFTLGIPKDTVYKEADKKGILVWSAASSVGSATLQIAKSMGFHVYATASKKHHDYLKGLGNGPGKITLFDYNDPQVVANIVKAGKEDGVVVNQAILATGNIGLCVDVLKELKGDSSQIAHVASIAWSMKLLLWKLFPHWRRTTVKFVVPTGTDLEKKETFAFIFNTWLQQKLVDGGLVPSPKPQVMTGGLQVVQAGLAEWKKGVSGSKIVIEL